MLLAAYRQGIFPWYAKNQPLFWWSPDPRMVLFPHDFHCSKRLKRRLRQSHYRFSWNKDFIQVIETCAHIHRKGESDTWILPKMIQAYQRMHQLGYAHSCEVWLGDVLIGGLYGILVRQVFFAESMFSRQRDGSKMAMAKLVERSIQESWKLIDCQFHTNHLASLGAKEISRDAFLNMISSNDS